jgi:hypothetical protein
MVVALLALPLAGISIERAPILAPLATKLVPLGTAVQSPPSGHSDLPSLLAPARLVLGPLPPAVFGPNADAESRIHNLPSFGLPESPSVEVPHGRSPPSH